MLAISLRVSPCSARIFRSSVARRTRTTLPSTCTLTPVGTVVCSFPFGPSMRTASVSTATLTPAGIVTGSFPIRDTFTPRLSLPHRADQFAADFRSLGLAVDQNPPGRRQDVNAEAFAYGIRLIGTDVDPAPRSADAL